VKTLITATSGLWDTATTHCVSYTGNKVRREVSEENQKEGTTHKIVITV
jgi:hypothetical protein